MDWKIVPGPGIPAAVARRCCPLRVHTRVHAVLLCAVIICTVLARTAPAAPAKQALLLWLVFAAAAVVSVAVCVLVLHYGLGVPMTYTPGRG